MIIADPETLKLEPIGIVLVFFFSVIVIIQFLCMLLHRWNTFIHILASTNLRTDNNQNIDEDLLKVYVDQAQKVAEKIISPYGRLNNIEQPQGNPDNHSNESSGNFSEK